MTNIDESASIDAAIAKARELAAKRSTSEPLTVSDGSKSPFLEGVIAGNRVMARTNYHFDDNLADAAFIAHACNSILVLADEVERLRTELLAARACAESGEMLRDRVLERRDTIDDYTEFATKLAQWRATQEAK